MQNGAEPQILYAQLWAFSPAWRRVVVTYSPSFSRFSNYCELVPAGLSLRPPFTYFLIYVLVNLHSVTVLWFLANALRWNHTFLETEKKSRESSLPSAQILLYPCTFAKHREVSSNLVCRGECIWDIDNICADLYWPRGTVIYSSVKSISNLEQ